MSIETGFEKVRGVSSVMFREGYAQVHVSRLEKSPEASDLSLPRIEVLRTLAAADLCLDFLKFTPSGLSCLIAESDSKVAEKALEGLGVHFSVRSGRSVVFVNAVNMRDEEGLIAEIVREAIASGARIEHITDTHDRVLIVVHSEDVQVIKSSMQKLISLEAI